MRTAMTRLFVTVALLTASAIAPPRASAVVLGTLTSTDPFRYLCQLKDSLGRWSLARCTKPCTQGCGIYKDRFLCNDITRGADCNVTIACGALCPVTFLPSIPGVREARLSPSCFCRN